MIYDALTDSSWHRQCDEVLTDVRKDVNIEDGSERDTHQREIAVKDFGGDCHSKDRGLHALCLTYEGC